MSRCAVSRSRARTRPSRTCSRPTSSPPMSLSCRCSKRRSSSIVSATATLTRLRGARATDLAALSDARRAIEQLKRARGRVTALERGVTGGLAALRAGVAGLDSAKQRDYAFARGLLKLPTLDAPEIGLALFAPSAVAQFQRALYWTQLARAHMPPGLLPRAEQGP